MPSKPLVGVIMGSKSDWETMRHASDVLHALGIAHECRVVSAHRMPDKLFAYAEQAEGRGLRVIIAGAGGAAHLPGMCASKTIVPVLGVPVVSRALKGVDSLLSIVQMPTGIPVGTLAIGPAGAANAGLLAAAILAPQYPSVRKALCAYRAAQTRKATASRVGRNMDETPAGAGGKRSRGGKRRSNTRSAPTRKGRTGARKR